MKKKQPDYTGPVEIAKDIFWVGNRTEKEFESNAYLRVFRGNGRQFNLLIDPGPSPDFKVISSKIEKVLGPNYQIDLVFLNHQDPDVCINTVYFQRHFPRLHVMTSEDTWRLVRFYGLKPDQFVATEGFKTGQIRANTGHYLRLIPTPYAHFRGACCLYDVEQRVLFTGDLFGGLSATPDLYADKDYWKGVKIFHQLYMPTNIALKKAVKAFRLYAKDMRIIAPQHGKIIESGLIEYFMNELEQLPVGLDLDVDSQLFTENYIKALNDILDKVKSEVDPAVVETLLRSFRSDGSFPHIFVTRDDRIISLKVGVEDALKIFCSELYHHLQPGQQTAVRAIVLNTLADWNIESDVHFPAADSSKTASAVEGMINFEQKDIDSLFDSLMK
ncbi:MAG: hypothetical protein BWK76_23595 [Desulfobulbaceae bacterium A2]|nr:MAG: hypothetical protein BWK76_23595 [Desulfobulbaceae bacterium A2]